MNLRQLLRILSLEDDPRDAELIQGLLEAEGIACEVTRVDTQPAFQASLEGDRFDLILADYTLPSFDGLAALKLARSICPDVPFIFVTGTLGEEVAIEALKIGATDYVLKTRLSRLTPSILRALREAEERSERKRAEEALCRNEAYLTEAQTLSHTGSFGWNVSSGEIYWSEETYKVFGLDRGVKPTLEFVFQRTHPDDRVRVQQKIDLAAREKTEFDLEHRLLTPDGSIKHLHVLARALETSSGDLEFVGAVTDITAAKRAEMKLRQSEAYLAEAQRISHTGSWAWNPATGENRYWSDECFRLMGFDPGGGMPPFEIIVQRFHPDDQLKFAERLERAGRERQEFEVDYRIIHAGGEIRDIHALGHPVLGPSGDLIEFVGSVIDVTERKKAEDNIRQSENELRHILDFAPQQVAVLGPDRTRIYSNQAMLDYLGLTREEWQSGDNRTPVQPDDWERMMSETHSKFLSGIPHEAELRLRRKDGKYRWFLFRYNPLRDEQGRLRRWYVAGTDIEDRKQAEESLRMSQADLAHANRVTTMGELAASLAHEVNQPISAAVTNASACLRWLDRDQPNLEEARAAATRILRDGKLAGEIISRIRSQFKKGTLREVIDVNEIIRETIALLRAEAMRHNVSLRTELATGLPQINGDRIQLQQVMMNLIVNSIDAMKDVDGTREITAVQNSGYLFNPRKV